MVVGLVSFWLILLFVDVFVALELCGFEFGVIFVVFVYFGWFVGLVEVLEWFLVRVIFVGELG